MPNYITHAVMGEIIEIPNPRVELDRKMLCSFSAGQDLMASRKGALSETHNSKIRKFFYTLIKIIKEEKLYDNPDVMAFLYGHIMHYQLDKTMHPYIYYMTNDIPKKGIVNFHMASEEYLGDFFIKNRCSLNRRTLAKSMNSILNIEYDDTIAHVIDNVYCDTFGYSSALETTKKTVIYIKTLEAFKTIMREGKCDAYYKFLGLPKYFEYAKMDQNDLINADKNTWKDPIAMKKSDKSALELFDLGMSLSQEVIEQVNKVIYGNSSISILDNIFKDESYDTGIMCSIGKPFCKSRYIETQRKTRA